MCSIVYSDVLVTNARACANVPLNLLTSNTKRTNAVQQLKKEIRPAFWVKKWKNFSIQIHHVVHVRILFVLKIITFKYVIIQSHIYSIPACCSATASSRHRGRSHTHMWSRGGRGMAPKPHTHGRLWSPGNVFLPSPPVVGRTNILLSSLLFN